MLETNYTSFYHPTNYFTSTNTSTNFTFTRDLKFFYLFCYFCTYCKYNDYDNNNNGYIFRIQYNSIQCLIAIDEGHSAFLVKHLQRSLAESALICNLHHRRPHREIQLSIIHPNCSATEPDQPFTLLYCKKRRMINENSLSINDKIWI